MDNLVWLIVLCAVVTYLTRVGGHLLLSRIDTIHHRLEVALNAVPVAVLSALVAPSVITKGPAEAIAVLVAGATALRFSLIVSVLAGMAALVSLRLILL